VETVTIFVEALNGKVRMAIVKTAISLIIISILSLKINKYGNQLYKHYVYHHTLCTDL